jgi:hypothetical protein
MSTSFDLVRPHDFRRREDRELDFDFSELFPDDGRETRIV